MEQNGDPVLLICPKCGQARENSPECRRCGLIFSKYQPQGFPGENRPRPAGDELAPAKSDLPAGQLLLLFILILVLIAAVRHYYILGEVRHPPGILAPAEPQQAVVFDLKPWKAGERTIFPMAFFRLKARVLGIERYRFDSSADLSPVDLALGWGLMSDQKVVDRVEVVQGSRRLVLLPSPDFPDLAPNGLRAPVSVLLANSANMHIIPADDGIRSEISKFRIGEIVELGGFLVGVQEHGQWTWVTSLSRTDVGDGACEIFWVNKAFRPYME